MTRCSSSDRDRYDVAVIGGGPAGAVAALTAQRYGREAVLYEASRYDEWRLGETVPPTVRAMLVPLGLDAAFDALDSIPSHGIRSYWGDSKDVHHSFLGNPYGHGWHLDRQAFDRTLVDAAERTGVTVHYGTRVETIEFDANVWTLDYYTPDSTAAGSVEVAGVIDATGRRSPVRRRLSGRPDVCDRLVAVAVRYEVPLESVGRYTLIESAHDGWWYSAPTPNNHLVVMWMTDADLLDKYERRDGWENRLKCSHATTRRVGDAIIQRGPVVAAAMSHRLRRTVGRKPWLAVGDAAVAVDPLSGSGVQQAIDTGVRGALAMDRWLDDDQTQAEGYEQDVDDAFNAYLERRRSYYSLESQWSSHPFWRRRQQPLTLPTGTHA